MKELVNKRFVTTIILIGFLIVSGCNHIPVKQSQPTATSSPTRTASIPQPTRTPTPEIPAEYKVEKNALKGIEILFLHPFAGSIADQFKKWADDFNQENPYGFRVKVEEKDDLSSLIDALEVERPTVILAPSEYLALGLEDGWITALDGYISLSDSGLSQETLKKIDESFWLQDRFFGAQSGFPALRTVIGLIYNTSWAKELGYSELPNTPQTLLEQACAAARQNNRSPYLEKRGTGGWLLSTDPFHAITWVYAFEGNLLPAKPGVEIQFEQGSVSTAFNFLRNMQAQGCLWQGLNPSPYGYFSDRYTLFYMGSIQDMFLQQTYHQNSQSQDEWKLIPFPRQNGQPFFLSYGFSYGLMKTEPALQMAGWLWIRWLSDPSKQDTLAQLYQGIPLEDFKRFSTSESGKYFSPVAEILPLPANPDWIIARRPIQDAFWQIFHLAEGQSIEEIITELQSLTKHEIQRIRSVKTP